MGGDLLEILFVVAFILFGVLGGRKKKPQPRSRPAPRPRPPRPQPGSRPEQSPQRAQDAMLRELEALLGGAPPDPPRRSAPTPFDRVPDPAEARSLETLEVEETSSWEEGLDQAAEITVTTAWSEGRNRGAGTLETLEGAGEASHDRYHERYQLSKPATVTPRQGPAFSLQDVRRAVIWAEILGPPVSQR